jgi:hypothetical protein
MRRALAPQLKSASAASLSVQTEPCRLGTVHVCYLSGVRGILSWTNFAISELLEICRMDVSSDCVCNLGKRHYRCELDD